MIEYFKDYDNIAFKVHYSASTENPDKINFAAHPYESLEALEDINEPQSYMIYGLVDFRMDVFIGFKEFVNLMTEDLHERLGLLYKEIKKEYLTVYDSIGKG